MITALNLAWAFFSVMCLYNGITKVESPALQQVPKTHLVEIRGMKYVPESIQANKGDSVIFINKDMVTHDVTEATGKSWKSPTLTPGKSWGLKVIQSTSYFCSFHPVMKGKISVSKSKKL